MKAVIKPCLYRLHGDIDAPPSKSMAHRYLIGAALSGEECTLSGVDYSEDILASIDCLRALGADVTTDGDRVTVHPAHFMTAQVQTPILDCRESGSTLRFFLPLALCLGQPVTLRGSTRLLERPLTVYEELCKEYGFAFTKTENTLTVCGNLKSGKYCVRGGISSQFITGLIFALVYLGNDSTVEILPPFESRSYIDLTLAALQSFGANVSFSSEYTISVSASRMHAWSGRIEGDYSNAAFLDAFHALGADVRVGNLNPDSLQGDRVYREYFRQICDGTPTLDVSDCPDLAPILFALAAMKNGAVFTGTDRLKAKESDRGMAMHEELSRLGGGLLFGGNAITVPKQTLHPTDTPLDGHNDHRIVMALSVILSQLGGTIDGAQATRKSYPGFFDDIKALGAEVDYQ